MNSFCFPFNRNKRIVFNKSVCNNFSSAIEKEWLETNGIGGYASSTIIGINTRRYHGLLTIATRPPVRRFLLLSKLEESLVINGNETFFSTNIYPNTIFPKGYHTQFQFYMDPFPAFHYVIYGVNIIKTVFMVYGENTTVITYQLNPYDKQKLPLSLKLKVRVMINFRDYHSLTHENTRIDPCLKFIPNGLRMKPYNTIPAMFLYHNAQAIDTSSFWYRNMEYPKEIERGLEGHEDHFSPCALEFDLKQGTDCYIVVSTKEYPVLDIDKVQQDEVLRRNRFCRNPYILKHNKTVSENKRMSRKVVDLFSCLLDTSESFIVKREHNKKSIIAGYHWFGDWGRDTMISLTGLCLVPGRFDEAREILLSYAQYIDKGMIPNRFPDYAESPEYNTVDASLWYIYAVYKYLLYTKDAETVRTILFGVLHEIVEYYKKGTRYNIHMDVDGLIYAGAEGVQLTWMDAKVGGWVVTPRLGKAVEINALWYNALCIMSFLSSEINLPNEEKFYSKLATRVSASFNEIFWFHDEGYLYDYINGETKNSSIRPNQIFALSLPYSLLNVGQQNDILTVVQKHLLTPYGLRSLSPQDRDYIGYYYGNVYERDRAYHQGTVWAWLIGPYISAYIKVFGNTRKTRNIIKKYFEPFYYHVFEAGLGTVSEIFDGNPPHTPRGCIAQAWSVAELLRIYYEYIVKPD